MALRLDLSLADSKPRWTPMGDGVSFLMRQATSVEYAAAEAEGAQRLREAIAGLGTLAELGVPVPATEDLADQATVLGYSRLLVACAIARRIVSDWRGVYAAADGVDVPLPLSPAAMAAYLRDPLRHGRFEAAAYQRLGTLIAEGKGSPLPPSGSPAAAANIAATAGPSEPPASTTAAVRRTRTARKPPKARRRSAS